MMTTNTKMMNDMELDQITGGGVLDVFETIGNAFGTAVNFVDDAVLLVAETVTGFDCIAEAYPEVGAVVEHVWNSRSG